jgi:hypothetical protein
MPFGQILRPPASPIAGTSGLSTAGGDRRPPGKAEREVRRHSHNNVLDIAKADPQQKHRLGEGHAIAVRI